MTQETPGTTTTTANESDERRFCSSCGRTKPLLGGALVRCANGAKRWKCADCRAKSKAHQASKAGGT